MEFRQSNELNSNELLVPTGSSAAKKQCDKEVEDELPRKKRLAAESNSGDGRCENNGGMRGDSSDDSSHLCSSSDESDSAEIIFESITRCSTSSSSIFTGRSLKRLTLRPVVAKNKSENISNIVARRKEVLVSV